MLEVGDTIFSNEDQLWYDVDGAPHSVNKYDKFIIEDVCNSKYSIAVMAIGPKGYRVYITCVENYVITKRELRKEKLKIIDQTAYQSL